MAESFYFERVFDIEMKEPAALGRMSVKLAFRERNGAPCDITFSKFGACKAPELQAKMISIAEELGKTPDNFPGLFSELRIGQGHKAFYRDCDGNTHDLNRKDFCNSHTLSGGGPSYTVDAISIFNAVVMAKKTVRLLKANGLITEFDAGRAMQKIDLTIPGIVQECIEQGKEFGRTHSRLMDPVFGLNN